MSSNLDPSLKAEIRDVVREALDAYFEKEKQQPATDTPTTDLMDIEEMAKEMNVSKKWLYNNATQLPFAKKLSGKMWRFSRSGLRNYLQGEAFQVYKCR